MKWYYQSEMEDDTLLVLKNYDSVDGVAKCMLLTQAHIRHPNTNYFFSCYLVAIVFADDEFSTDVPHCSFPLPTADKTTPPRQSIEVRAFLFSYPREGETV